MNIKEEIVNKYPLEKKIICKLDCFLLDKKRYLFFWDNIVEKKNIDEILNTLDNETKNDKFSLWKTLITVGKTNDHFNKEELVYFNNTNTIVVFYLINEKTNEHFMNDSWIFTLGLNYKKYVRKIYSILTKL